MDGHRVDEARLEPGQEVRFGDAIFKFVDRDAEGFERYRIDGTCSSRRRSDSPGDRDGSSSAAIQMDQIVGCRDRTDRPVTDQRALARRERDRQGGRRQGDPSSERTEAAHSRAVNCAAIPEHLFESELFGYKRGAFSGADRDKQGLLRAAHEGTLLLDEIGDMPLDAQAKLLRVLQSKEVYPLGATAPEVVDVRVVCATHRDLKRLQHEDRFRPDLFARLNEYQLRLPPLRDRKEDVYLLFRTFLARHGRADLAASFLFMTGLLHYDFPYNVRELEACAKRAIALAEGPPPWTRTPSTGADPRQDGGLWPRDSEPRRSLSILPTLQLQRHGTPTEAELRRPLC